MSEQLEDTNDPSPTEEQKEEALVELTRGIGGRVEGITAGASCALFTIALVRTGWLPLSPNSLSQLELLVFAAIFAAISGLLYVVRSHPHQKRLQEIIQECDEKEENS